MKYNHLRFEDRDIDKVLQHVPTLESLVTASAYSSPALTSPPVSSTCA